jgi:hypothetical protein
LPVLTGYDTISTVTSWGMPVYFLMPSVGYLGRLETEDIRDTLLSALEYMFTYFGKPRNISEIYIMPGSGPSSVPGVVVVSDYFFLPKEYGGFCHLSGREISEQWINYDAKLASYHEDWILAAFREYMALLFVQSKLGNKEFYTSLDYTRQTILNTINNQEDMALSSGFSDFYSMVKGTWVIHMIRNLINKGDKKTDEKFFVYLNDLIDRIYQSRLSNEQFCAITEEYFGYQMDWFFNKFLYGTGVPEYEVSYNTEQRENGTYLMLNVSTKNVDNNFLMPILIRIDFPNEPTYHNQYIAAKIQKYEFGPFEEQPTDLHFNKFYSVLSKVNILHTKQ